MFVYFQQFEQLFMIVKTELQKESQLGRDGIRLYENVATDPVTQFLDKLNFLVSVSAMKCLISLSSLCLLKTEISAYD